MTLEQEKIEQRKFAKEREIAKQQKDDVIKTTLENKIKSDIGDNTDNIGLSYYDINSGTYIGINDDKYFTAGSTVKVAIGMVYSDMIESGTISLTDTIMYDDNMYEDGAGVLQGSNLLNRPIAISNLMGYMIKDSDNIATNMLISKIGYYNIKDKFGEILGHAVDKNSNSITAKEAYTYLFKLYENKEHKQSYDNLKNLMKSTTTHDRIDKYIPQELVAHKIGDYGSFVNDIGIVYGDNPYILTIYTKNIPDANELIAKISKDIYNIQNTRE
jgi:beta-lactamase class A